MYVVELSGLPPSTNSLYSSPHWTKRKQLADLWHGLMWAAMVDAKLPKKLAWPVTIDVTQFSKGVPRDCDGVAITLKLFADTLVQHGYLPGDDPKYVSCVVLRSKKGRMNKCVIHIYASKSRENT